MARAKKAKETTQTVRAIKGFDADMRCRGFQFEVGKTYDHKGVVECCSSGFHACDGSPMDVWGYYGPVDEGGRLSRYAAVSMAGAISREGKNDSKLASGRITIEAEITLPQFVKKAVDWLIDATKGKDGSGNSARIGSSGNYARIGSSGYSARIGSSGNSAQIGSSGNYARRSWLTVRTASSRRPAPERPFQARLAFGFPLPSSGTANASASLLDALVRTALKQASRTSRGAGSWSPPPKPLNS